MIKEPIFRVRTDSTGYPNFPLDWKQVVSNVSQLAAGNGLQLAVINSDGNGIWYNSDGTAWKHILNEEVAQITFANTNLYCIKKDSSLWKWIDTNGKWDRIIPSGVKQVCTYTSSDDIAFLTQAGDLFRLIPYMGNVLIAKNVKKIYPGGYYLDNNNTLFIAQANGNSGDASIPSYKGKVLAHRVAEFTSTGGFFYKDMEGTIYSCDADSKGDGAWKAIGIKPEFNNLVSTNDKLFCTDKAGKLFMYRQNIGAWVQINTDRNIAADGLEASINARQKIYYINGMDIYSADVGFS